MTDPFLLWPERRDMALALAKEAGPAALAHADATAAALRRHGYSEDDPDPAVRERARRLHSLAPIHHAGDSAASLRRASILFGHDAERVIDCLAEGAGLFCPAPRLVRLMRSPEARALELACLVARAEDLFGRLDLDGSLGEMRARFPAFEAAVRVPAEHVGLWDALARLLAPRPS